MDAFCLPSTGMESFGNAAVEAMALGIPTIIFSDGGGWWRHRPGQTGFVVADREELADTIRRLLGDPPSRRVLAHEDEPRSARVHDRSDRPGLQAAVCVGARVAAVTTCLRRPPATLCGADDARPLFRLRDL